MHASGPVSRYFHNRAEPWLIRLMRRIPMHYAYVVLGVAIVIVLPSLGLSMMENGRAPLTDRGLLSRLLAPPLVIAYCLAMIRYLYDATADMMTKLRTTVLIGDDDYARLTYQMLTVDRRVDWVILSVGIASGVGAVLYHYANFMMARVMAERAPLMNIVIIIVEVLMAALVALFVYTGVERGVALYRLFQHPLAIDTFDHTNLAPLNSLSLRVTLALIGLVTLPILISGQFRIIEPVQMVVYMAVTLSAIVAFLLPLWGAHQYMTRVRDHELQVNGAKLKSLYRELHDRVDRKVDGRDVADEVNSLMQYQRLLENAPTWPYQGARIGIQLTSPIALPLIIYILQEMIGPLVSNAAK